jgi:monofunctional biosynthetic peptidoglycan transglycosylase
MIAYLAERFTHNLAVKARLPLLFKVMRVALRIIPILIVMDIGYLVGIWPDWELYAEGPIQKSSFIRSYVFERHRNPDWPELRWRPVPVEKIPRSMVRALIVAEDARFYSHNGIDLDALHDAVEYNLSEKRFAYGASTISQQTVKNVFLNPSRNPLRKWHELVLTIGMERNLSKKRVLELYLNVAEFGRGIYGVDAAAWHYWGIPASRLATWQAIELAATLPAPVSHNPHTRTKFFDRKVRKIQRYF